MDAAEESMEEKRVLESQWAEGEPRGETTQGGRQKHCKDPRNLVIEHFGASMANSVSATKMFS